MTESQEDFSKIKPAAERPPFAGFGARLLAFAIDIALLYFVFSGLGRAARPALLALNPVLPWLGFPIIFLYFWILSGPLSKGQTLGKALAGIQVVGRDGLPLTWGAAARRALMQFAAIPGVIFFINLFKGLVPGQMDATPSYLFLFPVSWWTTVGLVLAIVMTLGFTVLVMLGLCVTFHPYKRGWHDLWSGSFVTPTPPPASFRATLEGEPDPVTARKLAGFLKMTLIFWGVVSVVMVVMIARAYANPANRKGAAEITALRKRFSPEPYVLMDVVFPSVQMRRMMAEMIRMHREQLRSRGETVPTTESLRAQFQIDDETIYAYYFKRRGPFALSDLESPALRKGVEELRRELWGRWQGMPKADDKETSNPLKAKNFNVLLFEPMALVLYNRPELKGRAHGPADPARGGLTFEDVPAPPPQAADRPTTPTATPAAVPTSPTPGP